MNKKVRKFTAKAGRNGKKQGEEKRDQREKRKLEFDMKSQGKKKKK